MIKIILPWGFDTVANDDILFGESSEFRSTILHSFSEDRHSISLLSGEISWSGLDIDCEWWIGLWLRVTGGKSWWTVSRFIGPTTGVLWAAGGWLGIACTEGWLEAVWAGRARVGGVWLFGPFIKP